MTEQRYRYLRRAPDPERPYRRWIDLRYRALRIVDMVDYLVDRGWKEIPPDRPGFRAFQEPGGIEEDGRPCCQFVPDREESDLPRWMFELLSGLAEVEDRQASAIIDDILRLAEQRRQVNGVPGSEAHDTQGVR
jgi:hypothetical protein